MSLSVTTKADPILTASEMRLHCRIDHADEDGLLAEYLAGAVELIESHTGRPVGRTVYRLTLDHFPNGSIWLPRPPVFSIDSFTYDDAAGDEQTLAVGTGYQVDLASEPARIVPAIGSTWPTTQTDKLAAVRIDFSAGDLVVPARVGIAARMLVGTWYENRESVITGTIAAELPDGVARLLGRPFRDERLTRFLGGH